MAEVEGLRVNAWIACNLHPSNLDLLSLGGMFDLKSTTMKEAEQGAAGQPATRSSVDASGLLSTAGCSPPGVAGSGCLRSSFCFGIEDFISWEFTIKQTKNAGITG
jgi:hypothetical protein